MPDFTSALYLGLHHDSSELPPWTQLTTGKPSALSVPGETNAVALQLAALQGTEAVALAPSTLHVFWDLFAWLPKWPVEFMVDKGTYPIARWGVERAVARGARAQLFPHHDPAALRWRLRRNARGTRRRPVVITDGICPACGRVAPLRDYLEAVREQGGLLVVDDTQALGVLGLRPAPRRPYGAGGGGSLRWSDAYGPEVIIVASLAKGFGVPMAAVSGNKSMIRTFLKRSETRRHCSPPSAAVLHAACHALTLNDRAGDRLRDRLLARVRQFRELLSQRGLRPTGGLLPVQTLNLGPGCDAGAIHQRLFQRGVRTLLQGDDTGRQWISFLITARHGRAEIAQTTAIVADVLSARASSAGMRGGMLHGFPTQRISSMFRGKE